MFGPAPGQPETGSTWIHEEMAAGEMVEESHDWGHSRSRCRRNSRKAPDMQNARLPRGEVRAFLSSPGRTRAASPMGASAAVSGAGYQGMRTNPLTPREDMPPGTSRQNVHRRETTSESLHHQLIPANPPPPLRAAWPVSRSWIPDVPGAITPGPSYATSSCVASVRVFVCPDTRKVTSCVRT
jgi:hypothetical protein